MARSYSIKEFFRQMPNALLASFFQARGLFPDIDFSKLKETSPEPLFEAWLQLPEKERDVLDAEFQDIFLMGCEKGFLAIIDEAQWHMQNEPEKYDAFIDEMSALPNHYYRAMRAFLDYPEYWKGAKHFYHADNLSHWRKRKNLGHLPAATDVASLAHLADLIRGYFHQTEGRGNHCIVETLRRRDLDYFFAYPEDHSQHSVEWVNGEFGRRPHNPAFEIVFVYSQKDGTLDLNFRGSYKAVEPLQHMFATAILKLNELPPNPKDPRVYDLNPLRNRNFSFNFAIHSGIQSVALKKIRFSPRGSQGVRITLEGNSNNDAYDIYNQIEVLAKAYSLHLYNVTQVELAVSMLIDINKRPKTFPVRLTYPNSSSLKYDEVGLKLRQMLEASGVELIEPEVERVMAEELEV